MLKRKFLGLCIALCMVLPIAGCGENTEDATVEAPTVSMIESMDLLYDRGFYVRHDDKFLIPYIGDASFKNEYTAVPNPDKRRVLWFMDDFACIPTLYKGDSLIYCSTVEFPEDFILERFEDIGYTVGISNLKQRASGRFSLNTNPELYDHINARSDAAKLFELGDQNVTIETIGNYPLRGGNVTEGGTIRGLSKDKLYKTEVYTGTYLKNYDLVADSRAMISFEVHHMTNYEYLRSDIIELELPENLMTGYYLVNGQGLIRYVAGDSYDDNTDFNVPTPDSSGSSYVPKVDETVSDEEDTLTGIEVLYLESDSEYQLNVDLSPLDGSEAKPRVFLVGGDKPHELTYVSGADNRLQIERDLTKGTYLLQIYNADKDYEYELIDIIQRNREKQEMEKAEQADRERMRQEQEAAQETVEVESAPAQTEQQESGNDSNG